MNKTQLIGFRITAAMIALFLLAPFGMGQTTESADLWSIMRIGGQSVGYVHDVSQSDSTGHITTSTAFVLVINRFNKKVEIKEDSEVQELANGSLFKVRSETSSSNQSTVLEAVR